MINLIYKFKKKFPLYIKYPLKTFFGEIGKIPISLIPCHFMRSIIECDVCSSRMQQRTYSFVKKNTYNYIDKMYGKYVRQKKIHNFDGIKPQNIVIWIFWWQGEEAAPKIVRKCIEDIRKNRGQYSVQIIDQDNYNVFLDIPKHIRKKFEEKKISITHFSDYYRVALLEKYGGIWIDASICMTKQLNTSIFEKPMFTIRNPHKDMVNIANWNWTVGVLGGWKNNGVFTIVKELLSKYWEDHNVLIDYFVFDYMIKLVYDNNLIAKNIIDSIKPNNKEFYFLQNNANKFCDEEKYKEMLNLTTWFFKISWKGEYLVETEKNEVTFFKFWLDN